MSATRKPGVKKKLDKKPVRSAFDDLFSPEEAAELEIQAALLRGLQRWFAASGLTQVQAADVLHVSQARVSDIKNGKISQFSLGLLIRLAARVGLNPRVVLKKVA